MLALSTALSATLTAQLSFDPSQLKYCSTYRLAEAVDQENKQHGIYHLGSEYELAVTPKKITSFSNFRDSVARCCGKFRKHLENFVDHNIFQRTILFCILTNTFCMGIEFHSQPELLTKVVEISNLVFSCVFAVEMILKGKTTKFTHLCIYYDINLALLFRILIIIKYIFSYCIWGFPVHK